MIMYNDIIMEIDNNTIFDIPTFNIKTKIDEK